MEKRIRSYKYRIYPNKTQELLFLKTFGCVRFYWNQMVETFNNFEKGSSIFKTAKQMRDEYDFMKEVSSVAIQQKERDFDQFKKQFFSKKRKTKLGRPGFKSKYHYNSFRIANTSAKLVEGKLRLPKIGLVRIVIDRHIPKNTKILSYTVSKNKSNQYFVSIAVEEYITFKQKTNKDVGIDVGIKEFAIQSDGLLVSNLKLYAKNQSRLVKLQKYHSRSKKGSNRREKSRKKIAKLYQKISNQKSFFLHNYTSYLVQNYDNIFIEDLDTEGLKTKKILSKEISDASWGEFFRILSYKCEWYGKNLVKIDRFYPSSKTCCKCGTIKQDLTLKDRTYECSNCKQTIDRDLNASLNILKQGRRSLGDVRDGEIEVTRSLKRLEFNNDYN